MLNMKIYFRYFIYLLVILVLSACRSTWNHPFPDAEIVYQTGTFSQTRIGFVNVAGSNPVILKVGGYLRKPVWSSDSSLIYGLSFGTPNDMIGYPSFWSKDGGFKLCENWEHMTWIEGTGNPNNSKEVVISDARKILLVDLTECTLIKTLVDFSKSPDEKSRYVVGFSLSPDRRELLFGTQVSEMYEENGQTYRWSENRIIKKDLITWEEVDMVRGMNPSWSPDGSYIAYILADGIYIMNADGTQSRQLVNHMLGDPRPGMPIGQDDISIPRWSPDGQWIVYSRWNEEVDTASKSTIYKVNVPNGYEEEIANDGIYPSWKP